MQEKVGKDKKVYEYPEEFDWVTVILKKFELKKAKMPTEFNLKNLYSEFLAHNWYFADEAVKKALKYDELFNKDIKECPTDTIDNN